MNVRFFLIPLLVLGIASGGGCGGGSSSSTSPSPSANETIPSLSPWETVEGLEGGSIAQLAFTPDAVYALGEAGVFSVDAESGGFSLLNDNATLHKAGLKFEDLLSSALFDTLYAVVNGNLFRREGGTWMDGGETAHSLLEFDGVLYLRRQGEILSTGDGESWTAVTAIPSELSGTVCCLSRLVGDPVRGRLYLFNNKGVFYYSLATHSWSAMDVGDDLNQGPLTSLETLFVNPANGDVYVGTIFDLYVSTDGQTWSPPLFKQQTGAWGTPVVSIASGGDKLYVATHDTVFSKTGGPFTALPDLGSAPNAIAFHQGRLWAATASGVSIEDPATGWKPVNAHGLNTKTIQALALEDGRLEAQSDEIFNEPRFEGDDVLADFHAVYALQASGDWSFDKRFPGLTLPPAPFKDLELGVVVDAKLEIPEFSLRVAATENGILYSLKKAPWKPWNDGLPTFRISTLLYDPGTQTLYAGTIGHGVFSVSLN